MDLVKYRVFDPEEVVAAAVLLLLISFLSYWRGQHRGFMMMVLDLKKEKPSDSELIFSSVAICDNGMAEGRIEQASGEWREIC